MGYRDDVYQVWNIIGYTGALHDFPTVYFISPELQLGGHITQRHGSPNNVGRQEVFGLAGYTYRNETYEGRFRLVERWPGGGIHPSRNPLVEIDQANPDMATVAILARSITQCPEEKYISEMVEGDRERLIGAARAKGAMLAQMKGIQRAGDVARARRGL